MKIFVLGAGMMGRAVVYGLGGAREVKQIVVGDFDRARAHEVAQKFGCGKARAVVADVRETAHLARLLRGSEVVVNCTQFNWNLDVMRAALAARVDYMDLGGLYHMTRKQFSLDPEFRRIGRIAIAGMGGAPGITNVMARALAVGGIAMGLFFAAPFLPIYTPARARVYRLLKWAALIGVFCFVLGHDGLKYFWLLASCVWIPVWTEWTRFSIRRKMPVGEWPKQLYL